MTLALTRAAAVYPAAPAPARRTLLDVLADTATEHPNAAAIDAAGTVLTYRRLAEEVEATRLRLTEAGIGVGDRVGVRIASGTAELYVAILAVLSAGAAYVPVDADDPDERAELVFGEAGVCAVLGCGGRLTPHSAPIGTPGAPGHRDDAWIIFTSGSTGTPKGVAVSHGAAAAFVDAEARLFLADEPIGPGDRVLAGLSVAFDASCEEMWLAWRHGACLVPAPRALVRTGVDLGPWLVGAADHGRLHRADAGRAVAARRAGGRTAADLRRRGVPARAGRAAGRRGPRGVEHLRADRGHRRRVRRPADRRRAGADRAAAGRLGARGRRRRGRAGRDGRERRAGDRRRRARPLPRRRARTPRSSRRCRRWAGSAPTAAATSCAPTSGLLFLGRADEQIKLGGRRIELGEVDAALLALPGVARRRGGRAPHRARATRCWWATSWPQDGLDTDAAAFALRDRLPAALVPLLASVDDAADAHVGQGRPGRAALAAGRGRPTACGGPADTRPRPGSPSGWAEILGVPVTDPNADFFTHGGGSLTAAQLVARIRARHPQVVGGRPLRPPEARARSPARLDRAGARPPTAAARGRADAAPGRVRAGAADGADAGAGRPALGERRWPRSATSAAGRGCPWAPTVLVVVGGAGLAGAVQPAGADRAWPPAARGCCCAACGPAATRAAARAPAAVGRRAARRAVAAPTGVAGASWIDRYARALGAKVGKDVDLHSAPPVTGLLKLGRGAAVEPEVDLGGYWVDGDVVRDRQDPHRRGRRGRRRAARCCPARGSARAPRSPPGSTVAGAVPAGQRWAGAPAAPARQGQARVARRRPRAAAALAAPCTAPPASR